MVSIALEISITKEYFAWVLKLAGMVKQDKTPTKQFNDYVELTNVIYRDLEREDKEEQEDDE